MTEFYVVTNSFAAPFFSDTDYSYIEAETPNDALEHVAEHYSHPAGLYAAGAFTSADAKNKGEKPLATWLCNVAREKNRLMKGLGGCSMEGTGPDRFKLNGELHIVNNPREGSVS